MSFILQEFNQETDDHRIGQESELVKNSCRKNIWLKLLNVLLILFSGCVAEMRNLGKSNQICDGVVDCPDFSDELYCPYCPEHHFHCGVGKMCVPKDKMCDGIVDCDNGADEKGCCKNLSFPKGHLISKCLFGAFNSHFVSTTGTPLTLRKHRIGFNMQFFV